MFPNGKGTFDKIIKNISIIENKKYPFQLIKFNTTIVQDSYLSDQANFFDNLSKEKGYSPNPFFVNKRESNLNELIKKNPGSLDSSYIKELRSQFKHNLIKKNVNYSPFLKKLFLARLRKIHNRGNFKSIKGSCSPNGACIPGWEKLFVDSKGDFFICEKMTDFTTIGNVETGLYLNQIFKIIEAYCEICDVDCIDCWAIRLCKACYVAAKRKKRLDKLQKRTYCNNMKYNLLSDIKLYLEILETNPKAFDFLVSERQIEYTKNRLDYMKRKSI